MIQQPLRNLCFAFLFFCSLSALAAPQCDAVLAGTIRFKSKPIPSDDYYPEMANRKLIVTAEVAPIEPGDECNPEVKGFVTHTLTVSVRDAKTGESYTGATPKKYYFAPKDGLLMVKREDNKCRLANGADGFTITATSDLWKSITLTKGLWTAWRPRYYPNMSFPESFTLNRI